MDTTSKKILNFLESTDIELRLASLRILTELGELKGNALKHVDKILSDNDSTTNRKILNVLTMRPSPDLMNYYIPFLKEEDGIREQSLIALESLGPIASHTIQKQYKNADALLKRSFISLLARVPNRSNFEFLADAVLEEPLELQKHICHECREFQKKYSDKDRKVFEAVIREHIRIADKNKNSSALISFVILLGHLSLKSSLTVLMRYIDPKQPVELRRFALLSLGKILAGGKLDPALQKPLIRMLDEMDFPNIVQNVLSIVEPLPASKSFEKIYLDLMTSNPHNAVKNFALGKLAQLNSKVALERLTAQLMSGDSFLYEKAQKVLEQSARGIDYLWKRLDSISSPEAAEKVGALLAADRTRITPSQLKEMFRKVEKFLGQPNDKARIYFTLARKISPDFAYETTLKRVQAHKTKRAYDKAKALLDLISGTLLYNSDVKFEYAVLQLKTSKKDLALSHRNQDQALLAFQSLIPQKNFGLFDRVRKEKILTPDDVFYLGFHFSEKLFDQKDFGVQILKYLVSKFKKSSHTKNAKKKLELVGVSSFVPSISRKR